VYVQCDCEIKFGITKQSQVFDEDSEKNTRICAQTRAGSKNTDTTQTHKEKHETKSLISWKHKNLMMLKMIF
jgi:hypothetical protein